jgi:hypothetical protein
MTKKFTLELIEKDDGHLEMHSSNDGFSTVALLGALYFKLGDIQDQMRGKIKPDVVTRSFVEGWKQ